MTEASFSVRLLLALPFGPFLESTGINDLFWPEKKSLVNQYLMTERCIRLHETSCMKRSPVRIQNI